MNKTKINIVYIIKWVQVDLTTFKYYRYIQQTCLNYWKAISIYNAVKNLLLSSISPSFYTNSSSFTLSNFPTATTFHLRTLWKSALWILYLYMNIISYVLEWFFNLNDMYCFQRYKNLKQKTSTTTKPTTNWFVSILNHFLLQFFFSV